MRRLSWSVLLLCLFGAAAAAAGGFDPREAFGRLALPEPVTAQRGPDGAPGPGYWQNRADYSIRAQLLPEQKQLIGSEVITYTNNSPHVLDSLWLQLDQNTYRSDSRSNANGHPSASSGYQLDSVAVEFAGKVHPADFLISDTRMQIRLDSPLRAHGVLRLRIGYRYTVPGIEGGRTAWAPSRKGDIFDIAQWYPRMAVFDDLRGWDTLPYLTSEFYLEYGDFDYFVTVPAAMVVAGSGELVNPQEVLTAHERAQLEKARHSDSTVMIRGPEAIDDPAATPPGNRELTWHFRMRHTRDVAFAASRAFVWDAARINLPDHRSALAMSVYPAESGGPDAWGRATQYFKDSVERFSSRWYPYPWPVAVNVGGPVQGMEYPGMAFDQMNDKGKALFYLSAHEIGHTWFPMIVGFNERRDTWMDEGFNTFIDIAESDEFNHGEFGPKRDGEYAPGGGNPVEDIQSVLKDPDAPALMTNADAIPRKYSHTVSYFKSALGLVLLRERILGHERFDFAFRSFIRNWAFRHPAPSDFFRAMNSAGGEDLSWFWRGWYFNNWNIDLAVTRVAYADGDPAKGATVTLASLDRLVLPCTLQITYADGNRRRIEVPVEAWLQKNEFDVVLPGGPAITEASVDPDQTLPDADRHNNILRAPFAPQTGSS